MYLDNALDIPKVVSRAQFSIIAHPPSFDPKTLGLDAPIIISPDEKGTIRLEALSALREFARSKQVRKIIIPIFSADSLTESAENSLLKILEQPNDNISFAFFTTNPSRLLPTIRSRAHLYYVRSPEVDPADPKLIPLARELVGGGLPSLLRLSSSLAKDRAKAIAVVETAIAQLTIAECSSPSPVYLSRLAKLLALHSNLENNGHVRLHLVADML